MIEPGKQESSVIVHRKTLGWFFGVLVILHFIDIFLNSSNGVFRMTKAVPGFIGCFMGIVEIFLRKKKALVEWALYLIAVSLVIIDLDHLVNRGMRVWSVFVLLCDISLFCRLRTRVARNIIAMVILWLAVVMMETTTRFGLFDLSFLTTQEERQKVWGGCSSLPCSRNVLTETEGFLARCTIFVLDFYFTRLFATGLYEEHKKMDAVITAAEGIASCLSKFDLVQAELILQGSVFPPPLHGAFSTILVNLQTYRPYLPQFCLQQANYRTSGGSPSVQSSNVLREPSENTAYSSRHSLVPALGACCSLIATFLEKRKASFLVANMLDTHARVATNDFPFLFEMYISTVLDVCRGHGGVVGIVLGDRVHCSFNASKKNASHAKCSIETGMAVVGFIENVVAGVSTGLTHCGTLGCQELLSHSTIGAAAVAASVAVHYDVVHGLRLTCAYETYKETYYLVPMRLLLTAVRLRSHIANQTTIFLYEVLDQAPSSPDAQGEWMYQMQKNDWERFNEAARAYLLGVKNEASRLLSIQAPEDRPPEVMEQERFLFELLKGSDKPSYFEY